MSSTSDQTTQQNKKTRLIIDEVGVDTETGIIGRGHSYDNGKTFTVDKTIYGRIFHKSDHDQVWKGIQDKVKSLGMVSDLNDVLKAADLFLLPSEQESFGLAALEAMAASVPVISSNAGGIPEVNIDGLTGFVCPVGDIEMMAEKAIYILEDDKRLAEFSHQAKEQAIRFDKTNILPQYEELYRKVIAKSKIG